MATLGPIRTQVDVELANAPRGEELAAAVARRRSARAPTAMAPTRIPNTDPALTMTWADFQVRHPEWQGDFWEECRALYAGGQRLLADQKVLARLFPQHTSEDGK